jgi:hypothetical protein
LRRPRVREGHRRSGFLRSAGDGATKCSSNDTGYKHDSTRHDTGQPHCLVLLAVDRNLDALDCFTARSQRKPRTAQAPVAIKSEQ